MSDSRGNSVINEDVNESELTIADVLNEIKRDPSRKAAFHFSDLAEYLNVSESTARRMAKQPGFPQRREIQTDDKGNSMKLFAKADIDKWLVNAPISRAS